jgi:hypothetical protein
MRSRSFESFGPRISSGEASEIRISLGIFSVGFLLFTLMVRVATPIMLGEFRARASS